MAKSSKGPSQRQLRVGEMVRHALMQLLQRGDIPVESLDRNLVSVSEVSMSPDLKIATAFVAPLGDSDVEDVVRALTKNAKLIRGKMSPYLAQMKYMPDFRFRKDTSFENYSRIDALLRSDEVKRDLED